MVVADQAATALIVINLTQFEPEVPVGGDVTSLMQRFELPTVRATTVEFSYDGSSSTPCVGPARSFIASRCGT
jgi:hypothetical protein